MSEKVVLELSVYTDGGWSFSSELFQNYVSKYFDSDLFEYTYMHDHTLKIRRTYEGVDNGFRQVYNLVRQFTDSIEGRADEVEYVKEFFSRCLDSLDDCEEVSDCIDSNTEIDITVSVVSTDSKRIKKILFEDDTNSEIIRGISRPGFYSYDIYTRTLTVFSNMGVRYFCADDDRLLEEFNFLTIIDPSCTSCESMFSRCKRFDRPVEIPDGITSCREMFKDCESFNQQVTIPGSVTCCVRMFENCKSLNRTVTICEGVDNCYEMFRGCRSFNQPITIPSSVTECTFMFTECLYFNQPITIPDSVTFCSSMFVNCLAFNQPVILSKNTTDYSGMFEFCRTLNQPITIPEGVTECYIMFHGCSSFNQSVTIPDSVADCSGMFKRCTSLNKLITIPEGIKGLDNMFDSCPLMNRDGTPKNAPADSSVAHTNLFS